MLTRDELAAVAELAVERDLVVITDEVYEHLTYTGHEHVPMATLPGMAERTLTLSSAGKSYSFTGWKVGWATGPAELVGALLAAKQWLTFTSGSPLQPAVATALDEHPDFPAALAAELEGKRDLLCAGLEKVGLPGRPPAGHVLRHLRHHPPRVAGRDGLLPGAARAGGRGRDPDPAVLRRPGRRPPADPLGVLQADVGDRGGAQPAGRGRPRPTAERQ